MKNCKKTLVIGIFSLAIIFLTGCWFNSFETPQPTDTPIDPSDFLISSPQLARDAALQNIRENHNLTTLPNFNWSESKIPAPENTLSNSYLYSYKDWVVTVSFPNAITEDSIINVLVINDRYAFEWQGSVDPNGNSVETFVDLGLLQPTATKLATATPSETPTLIPDTLTPIPTATSLPTRTPTSTPTPVYSPTPTPPPCNAADFITDVTIPDGSSFSPNAVFVKTWRIENVGTCTWTTDYDLVFVDGHPMEGPNSVALPENVSPGETVDLSVRLSAPPSAGDYQGFWRLRDAGGETFGVGEDADFNIWVSVTVIETAGDFEYDFAIQHCSATWWSETARLQCDDTSNAEDGFVRLLTAPELENRSENEPTLWVHPNETRYGWIEGTYPAYTVHYGDIFKAWVGCMADNARCNVTFYLAYQTEVGRIYTLERWIETYDKEVTMIDLNLSDLAGKTVQFILGMEANTHNVEDAQGFWFVPRIERHAGGGE